MKVLIRSLLEGAKSAEGIAIIIDVVNASSTIVQCFEEGAKEVVPVKSMNEAIGIKKNTGSLICGEMKNLRVRPDFYNSPYSALQKNLKNKKIVIKTEAGTKGILEAKKAKEVILGCFLNCSAVVRYVKTQNPNTRTVTLAPMGDYGTRKNVEDEVFAVYLKTLLENRKTRGFEEIKSEIKRGSTRNIFRSIFLGKHIDSSLKLDTSQKVPRLVNRRLLCNL